MQYTRQTSQQYRDLLQVLVRQSYPQFLTQTDTTKDMIGVPALKLLSRWPIGVLAPLPMLQVVHCLCNQAV